MLIQNPYGRGANVASALSDVSNSLKGMMKDEMDSRRIERKMKLDEMLQESNLKKIEVTGRRDKMARDIALSRLQFQDALETKKLEQREREATNIQDYRLKTLAGQEQGRKNRLIGIRARAGESGARQRQVERGNTPVQPSDYFGKRSGEIATALFGKAPRTRREWANVTGKNQMFQNLIAKVGLEDLYEQTVASGDTEKAAQIRQVIDKAGAEMSTWAKKGGIEKAVAAYALELAKEEYPPDEVVSKTKTFREGLKKGLTEAPDKEKKRYKGPPPTKEELDQLKTLVLQFNKKNLQLKAKDIRAKIKEVGAKKTIEFLMGRYNSLLGVSK